jgi:glycosyltransferase involved in cell wall biosynthesis
MPLFSVIIPAYNRAQLIGATLDSILNQEILNPDDLEIIVVDDGSTDATLDVVAHYGPRVRILRQQNRGPGAARNHGLREATGEYVAFLDSDDLWFPSTAETYRRVIEKHHRPAFVAGKPFIFDSDAQPRPTAPQSLETLEFPDYYASGDQWRWFSASSFVMRRQSLIAAGGFADEWINGEDAFAALRMGDAGKFVQISSPFTFGYRRHAGSAMSNQQRSFSGMMQMITDEQAGRFPGGSRRARERTKIIAGFARPLCVGLVAENRVWAWDLYRKTLAWQVGLYQWKFVLGLPVAMLMDIMHRHRHGAK